MVNTVSPAVIYSNNKKLHSTMTLSGVSENTYSNKKERDEMIELFKKVDTDKSGDLTEEEIKAYDSECSKKKWKTAALIAGGVLGLVGIGFAIYKGVKMNKALEQAKEVAAGTKTALAAPDGFIQAKDVFASHNFGQYGKAGIPLKYSRETFVKDILSSLEGMSVQEKTQILEKFNLKLGVSNIYEAMKDLPKAEQEKIVAEIHSMLGPRDINTTICELAPKAQQELYKRFGLNMNIGDLDGVPVVGKTGVLNPVEQRIEGLINKFYHENETVVSDPKVKAALDKVLSDFPEFGMTIGKHQHITHLYSVDIHTLEVLKSSLNNPAIKNLSAEDKMVLELSVLMHDFGKKGNIVTKGHAAISKIDAEKILEHYDLPKTIKERIINQVANHHWFENYNKGLIDEKGVLDIFKTESDLTIAKMMAKGDLEGVSPVFHRKILHPGKILTQEEFNAEFAEKLSKIHF